MTWNLWWRFGPWELRQPAIAAVLREVNADIICLQEVWADDSGSDQAAQLAGPLGYHHCRAPSPYWNGLALGNAVLSRWPILSVESVPLPGSDGRPGHRMALLAEIDTPVGPVPVMSTHLDYQFDQSALRATQLRSVCELAARRRSNPETDFPLLIGGDLNAVPDSDEIRMITGRSAPPVASLVFQDAWEIAGDGSPGYTWSADNPYVSDSSWPRRRIDYLLISWPRPKPMGTPSRCFLAGVDPVDGVQPSDHYAVVADLR